MTKPKIFIGLREIAGYFSNLKGGFDEIGVEAAFLNLGGNQFSYQQGKNPKWIVALNIIGSKFGSKFSKNFFLRFIWLTIFQNIFSLFAFFIAVFSYDIFIFGSNSTFFYFLDLPILKLFKKKIVFVFLGSDSRPLYLNGYVFKDGKNKSLLIALTWLQKRIIRIIEKYSTVIINHPPQALFHEKSFISSLMIGLPYMEKSIHRNNEIKFERKKDIRIIHVPSKSGPKGSYRFRELLDKLKTQYEIQYIEISGVPNKEVIDIISNADFAIDELYSDTPMAVFATECAFQKVPVIIGSNYADSISHDYDKRILPPSMFVLPEEIEAAIVKLIVDEEYRKKLGKEAYDFVTKNWSANVVAKKYLQLISGEFPLSWKYDPNDIKYIYGCGLSKEQVKENVKLFIEKKGICALQLADKPALEKEYLNLINK